MKNKPQNYNDVKKVLLNSLHAAGDILKKGYGRSHSIKMKGPVNIVTEIDMAAEKKILGLITKNFPDHRILSEESSPKQGISPYRWVIDPLDGTTNFAHGIPICAVSIGLEYEGKMVLGGIYNPLSNEFFWAEKGKGTYLNGKRVWVSKTSKLINSLVVTGFPYDTPERAKLYLKYFEVMIQRSRGIRRLGAAAIDLAYVACGRFDAFWELHLQPWDIAAGVLMVEESGGVVTTISGEPLSIDSPIVMLSSNGLLHRDILKHFKPIIKQK